MALNIFENAGLVVQDNALQLGFRQHVKALDVAENEVQLLFKGGHIFFDAFPFDPFATRGDF